MTEDRLPPDDEGIEPSDDEMGEPIAELAGLREAARPHFLRRLQGRIQRRELGSQVLDLGVPAFLDTCLEFLGMLFAPFGGKGRDDDRKG